MSIGTVTAVSNSPGPASGIRWDVLVNLPGDDAPLALQGVGSNAGLPPDEYDSVGQGPDTAFEFQAVAVAGSEDRDLQLLLHAFPFAEPCESGATGLVLEPELSGSEGGETTSLRLRAWRALVALGGGRRLSNGLRGIDRSLR